MQYMTTVFMTGTWFQKSLTRDSRSEYCNDCASIRLLCCCHAWLGWLLFNTSSRYAWEPMLDRTLFDYVTCGHINFRTGLLKLVLLLLEWTGVSDYCNVVNTLLTHCIANGQGSAAERNNMGQLTSTLLHYCEFKLLHSGDNVQSLYNKIEQMRHVLDARGNNILGITETWLKNCHTNCEIAIQ